MKNNAYILDWTMDDYEGLKTKLTDDGFSFENDEGGKNHIRVTVPYDRIDDFTVICQQHLNKEVNYVDAQFPEEKKTAVIFQNERFIIENEEQDKKVKTWAIDKGLPAQQADWGTSF